MLWALILGMLLWHADGLRRMRDAGLIPLYDFIEYWAASRILVGGGNPYSPAELMQIQREAGWKAAKPIMMWNPPWTFPLVLPFSLLSYWDGRAFWFLMNLVIVFVCADWFWRLFGGPLSRRWISWLAALFFIPAGTSLFVGQISPLILAGVAGFLWALSRKQAVLAGAFTLLLGIKPHLLYLFWIFLILWIIEERQWRVFFGAVVSVAAASLLVLLVNRTAFIDYYHAIRSPSGPQIWQTPTWGVALGYLFPDAGDWLRFLPSLAGVLLAFWLWRSWRRAFEWSGHLATIILLSVTSSSFTWMFDWVILLPVVILTLCRILAMPAPRWWLLGALASTQPLLVFTPAIERTNFYTIWLPPVLWFLYWAANPEYHRHTVVKARYDPPA